MNTVHGIYNLFKYFILLLIFSVLDLLISRKCLFIVIVTLSIYPYILDFLLLYIFRNYVVRVIKVYLIDNPSYYSEIFPFDHFNNAHLEFFFV